MQVTTILSDAVDAKNQTSTYAESRTQVHVVLHEPHALVARPAPVCDNALKIESKTTHVIVRWRRVESTAYDVRK